MKHKIKNIIFSFSRASLITLLVFALTQVAAVNVFAQAPGIIIIISSDTTWTKADSPHVLTGPVFVRNGVTLTIEAGVSVDCNGYNLLVNGTLRVLGSSSEQVYIGNGEIEFTEYSTAWSEPDSGCILEHANINSTITLHATSVKINNCVLNLILLEGVSSPIISNNDIDRIALSPDNNIFMGSPTISNNVISRIGSSVEMYIASLVDAGSPTISHNIINGEYSSGSIHLTANSPTISDNVVVDGGIYVVAVSAVITNNVVNGSVKVKGCEGSVAISNNTITLHSRVFYSRGLFTPPQTVRYHGIFLEGSNKLVDALISENTISGGLSGIKLSNLLGSVTVERNVVRDNDDGISVEADINLTIVGNFIHNNNDNGLKDYLGKANMVIRNNTITNNSHGITDPGPALIERNVIADNSVGLDLASQATVQNNTIINNDVAIRLKSCPSAKINYNNIENYGEKSIYLINTLGNVDATNNWWGTTNTQTINLTIHDYKYDLDLSKVNFAPFLTEQNTEATSDPIPEFASWIILPLFLAVTFVSVVIKKKIRGGN